MPARVHVHMGTLYVLVLLYKCTVCNVRVARYTAHYAGTCTGSISVQQSTVNTNKLQVTFEYYKRFETVLYVGAALSYKRVVSFVKRVLSFMRALVTNALLAGELRVLSSTRSNTSSSASWMTCAHHSWQC